MNVDTPTAERERLDTLEQQAVHALKVHYMWRETTRAILSPARGSLRLDPGTACPIHTWLTFSLHPQFRRLPLYERTIDAHNDFHRAIQALYDDPPSGRRRTAAAAMALKDCLEAWLTLSRRRSPAP